MKGKGTGKALPTGLCGCGERAGVGKHFVTGHDRKAEGALVKVKYGSIAEMLAHHGFGPEKSVVAAAERLRTG